MSNLELRTHRVAAQRAADWRRLHLLPVKGERGPSALNDNELIALPLLYRAAVSSLSVARATSLDTSLVAYLEALVSRAYFYVYGTRTRLSERLSRFFRVGWPEAMRALWRETAVAGLILLIGAMAGYALVARDADWFGSIMPAEMVQGRGPTASTAFLKSVLYDNHAKAGLSMFATFLFTHNAQIAILAFALGFAFCVPTALLVAQNGLGLGALVAVYVSRGLGWQLGGWLVIHGTTEIFAVTLAGAAGFRIGWAVIFPWSLSRLDALAAAGRVSGAAMAGVVIMLVVAGVLEGFGRQLIQIDGIRWSIGVAALVLWCAYFYLPRRTVR